MIKLTASRAAWGAVLLLAPDAALRTVNHGRSDPRARRVTQVLGARELLQGLIASRHRSRAWGLSGAAVDVAHAATMVALAIQNHTYRRPAAVSSLAAASFAIAGLSGRS